MKKIFAFFCLSIGALSSTVAQTEMKLENYVYSEDIKSVQCIVNGVISSVPVMRLNSSDKMTLQFDDLGEEEDNEYFYKLIHCDKDWNASTISDIEFVDGFVEERLRDWQLSLGTKIPFTHYWMTIPNRDTRIKISGNYILLIFDKNDNERPLITRRFIVAESFVTADRKWVRPTVTEDIRFKQQLNISLFAKNIKLLNPQRDVTMTIIQNGDWSGALTNLTSRSYKDGLFTFDNFGQICFWGGNEYRYFDMRSLRGRGQGIKKVEPFIDGTDVILDLNYRKDTKVYSFNYDFNGNFYIDNEDIFSRPIFNVSVTSKDNLDDFRNNFAYFEAQSSTWQVKEKELRSDYAKVIFTLKSSKLENDVYLYGAFTDFQLKPEFIMKYNEQKELYFGEFLLKQGYYDYTYAIKSKNGKPEFKITEGTWQDTENEYKAIVYLREFGTRYDRVIGVTNSNSSEVSN